MKNLAIFIDVEYGSGGTFQYNQQILSALLSLPEEFHIHVFYTDNAWTQIIPPTVNRTRVNYSSRVRTALKILFRVVGDTKLMKWAFQSTDLARIMNQTFDLMFFPSQDLAGLFLSSNPVNVVHDLMHRYEPSFKESSSMGRGQFRDRLYSGMCLKSKVVLVDSVTGKKQLMDSYRVPGHNIKALPYIAPAHIVNYKDEQHREFFSRVQLPKKFFFYPAQFWPHKNHIVLLQALILLKDKYPDLHLVFTGPKRHAYDSLFKFAQSHDLLNNVHFIDFVPNEVLGGFYLRARALVMPTFYGPTNIPPLEAIALGCPPAVSRIYGMPDQLGEAALYFDNKDVGDVAAALERLWTDDHLIQNLKQNASRHFASWNELHFNQELHHIIHQTLKN